LKQLGRNKSQDSIHDRAVPPNSHDETLQISLFSIDSLVSPKGHYNRGKRLKAKRSDYMPKPSHVLS